MRKVYRTSEVFSGILPKFAGKGREEGGLGVGKRKTGPY
jgi:hypothetical protein